MQAHEPRDESADRPERGEAAPGTVLVVSPVLPWPPSAGKHLDVEAHVAFFRAAGWRVVLVVYREISEALEHRVREERFPAGVHLIERGGRFTPASEEATAMLQALIDREHPDVLWCAHTDTVPLVAAIDPRGAPVWWRPQNFELGQHFEKARPGFRWRARNRWSALLTWLPSRTGRRIHAAERAMHSCADRIFYISRRDQEVMTRLYGKRSAVSWLPPRLPRARVETKPEKQMLDIVYVANNYSSPTQVAGARRLVDEIAPRVQSAAPGAFRFHLVGRGSEALEGSFDPSVVVAHGYVEDLEALLATMDASCIPVGIGWGLKIKMVEALASGLPVLGDPLLFRSLPDAEGAFAVCAGAEDYVRALLELREVDARRSMAESGVRAYEQWLAEGEALLSRELESLRPLR